MYPRSGYFLVFSKIEIIYENFQNDVSKNTMAFVNTRKYPLCEYILGVLMHTTAWYRLWERDETLMRVLICATLLYLA